MRTMTGYCLHGRHKRCPYRPAGPCHGGIAVTGGSWYICPCACHVTASEQSVQLNLFEAV